MFKVIISDSVYEQVMAMGGTGIIGKLLKQQPSRLLSSAETYCLKRYPEEALKSPSLLYILDASLAETLCIQICCEW